MADMEELFRQVDEELEAEKLRKLWERYRVWIVTGFVLFFLALFAYVGWREWQQRQDMAAAGHYLEARQAAVADNWPGVHQALEPLLAERPGHGYGQLGGLLDARALAAQGEREQALAQLDHLLASTPRGPVAAMTLMQAAYLAADGDPQRAGGYLDRLPADSAFQALALELRGLMAAAAGDANAALGFYRQALEKHPGGPLAQRLNRRVAALGGPTGQS